MVWGNVVVLATNHVEGIMINHGYLMYNNYENELKFYGLGVLMEIEIS